MSKWKSDHVIPLPKNLQTLHISLSVKAQVLQRTTRPAATESLLGKGPTSELQSQNLNFNNSCAHESLKSKYLYKVRRYKHHPPQSLPLLRQASVSGYLHLPFTIPGMLLYSLTSFKPWLKCQLICEAVNTQSFPWICPILLSRFYFSH